MVDPNGPEDGPEGTRFPPSVLPSRQSLLFYVQLTSLGLANKSKARWRCFFFFFRAHLWKWLWSIAYWHVSSCKQAFNKWIWVYRLRCARSGLTIQIKMKSERLGNGHAVRRCENRWWLLSIWATKIQETLLGFVRKNYSESNSSDLPTVRLTIKMKQSMIIYLKGEKE